MDRHKSEGVDNVHAKMLQIVPELFARLLESFWENVGENLMVPEAWNMGILVPLHKKDKQDDPAKYWPLCMLSHICKVPEKAVTATLEQFLHSDRMQYGFQRYINILQAAIEKSARLEEKIGQLLAVLDLPKACDKVIRQLMIDKLR